MIKRIGLLWVASSIILLSSCAQTEAVTEKIMASSSIESGVEVTSMATEKEESKENEEFYSESANSARILKVPNPNHLYILMAIH